MPSKDRRTPAPRLSDMEWEVMKPLWKRGPMAARDIYDSVPDSFGWAYETVKTMLARLVKKGVLRYQQVGNSYLYSAVFTRSEMAREATTSLIRRVFDGGLSMFFAHFVEHASEEELAALKAELTRAKKQRHPPNPLQRGNEHPPANPLQKGNEHPPESPSKGRRGSKA